MITPASDASSRTLPDLIGEHARLRPDHPALRDEHDTLSYAELDALMDRIAAALQRDGVQPGQAIAICAGASVRYAALFMGALRAGAVVAPLAPSSTAEALASMLRDAEARLLFVDAGTAERLPAPDPALPRIALDGSAGGRAWGDWRAPAGARPQPVAITPEAPFNII